LSQGDSVIVIKGGKFGERWGDICEVYGVSVITVDIEYGRAVDPNVIDNMGSELIKPTFG